MGCIKVCGGFAYVLFPPAIHIIVCLLIKRHVPYQGQIVYLVKSMQFAQIWYVLNACYVLFCCSLLGGQDATLESLGVSHGDILYLLYHFERNVEPAVKLQNKGKQPFGSCITVGEGAGSGKAATGQLVMTFVVNVIYWIHKWVSSWTAPVLHQVEARIKMLVLHRDG
jgi:hypothetical protein